MKATARPFVLLFAALALLWATIPAHKPTPRYIIDSAELTGVQEMSGKIAPLPKGITQTASLDGAANSIGYIPLLENLTPAPMYILSAWAQATGLPASNTALRLLVTGNGNTPVRDVLASAFVITTEGRGYNTCLWQSPIEGAGYILQPGDSLVIQAKPVFAPSVDGFVAYQQ